MLRKLKERALQANLEIVINKLVLLTWGNASLRDPESGYIVIKPSGVPYDQMTADDMVVLDKTGRVVEGEKRPSSDTPTHIHLYKCFPEIGGIVHTHSEWATSWAQAGRNLPAYGTTHADHFFGKIPCTRILAPDEIEEDYEVATGRVIEETFSERDHMSIPAVLVHGHGPFTWGRDEKEAVLHSLILEEVAKMAFRTEMLGNRRSLDQFLLDKHYQRKHGNGAYYGQ